LRFCGSDSQKSQTGEEDQRSRKPNTSRLCAGNRACASEPNPTKN
jgi:hypothetical protein